MKIDKIINNNVVSTCDEEGREIIVMGRGVGFKAKEGNTIDEEKVEKIFRLESQNTMDRLYRYRQKSLVMPKRFLTGLLTQMCISPLRII